MRTLFKTSAMIVAIAAMMGIFATPAMAGPFGMDLPQMDDLIDEEALQNLQHLGDEGYEVPPCDGIDCDGMTFPDGGDDEAYFPPDEDDDPVEPGDEVIPDGGDDEPGDTPQDDNPGVDDGQDTPGVDQPTTPETPEQPASPQSPPATSSKLPNTGSTLALYAAIGIAVILAALVARRLATRRVK